MKKKKHGNKKYVKKNVNYVMKKVIFIIYA